MCPKGEEQFVRPAAKWAAECIAMSPRSYHPDRAATDAERKRRHDAKRRADTLARIGDQPPGGRREADAQAAFSVQFEDWGRSWRKDVDSGFRPRHVGIVVQRQLERVFAEDMGESLTSWERQCIGEDDKRRSRRTKAKKNSKASPSKVLPSEKPKKEAPAPAYSLEENLEWALDFMRTYEARSRRH
jgi:hypothetical protein